MSQCSNPSRLASGANVNRLTPAALLPGPVEIGACPRPPAPHSLSDARVLLLPFEHACECRSRVRRIRSDPDTTVLIPPIAFEPFDRPRRLIIGNHPPGRLSRNLGW